MHRATYHIHFLCCRKRKSEQMHSVHPLTINISKTCGYRGFLMLIEDAYRVIPVSPPAFSHLPSSSFLPQFPKNNNNNNRMPSVNIIEV